MTATGRMQKWKRIRTTARPQRVSIGLPVYNGEDTSSKPIELHSTNHSPNLELIVSDNAATSDHRNMQKVRLTSPSRCAYLAERAFYIGGAAQFDRHVPVRPARILFRWGRPRSTVVRGPRRHRAMCRGSSTAKSHGSVSATRASIDNRPACGSARRRGSKPLPAALSRHSSTSLAPRVPMFPVFFALSTIPCL